MSGFYLLCLVNPSVFDTIDQRFVPFLVGRSLCDIEFPVLLLQFGKRRRNVYGKRKVTVMWDFLYEMIQTIYSAYTTQSLVYHYFHKVKKLSKCIKGLTWW